MAFLKSLGSSVSLLSVLAAAVLFGMALLVWPRTRRFAKHWLLWVTGTYIVFGLPVVANLLADSLPAADHDLPVAPVRTLVILDGDNRRGRLREAIRILRDDDPATVWILGDEWFLDELEGEGFPHSRFLHETGTNTTREQMDWVARFAAGQAVPPAIVASRLQMPRVVALARSSGSRLTFVASPIDDEPPVSGWREWVPSYIGLRTSRDAVYELLALRYYRWKGWIN